MRKLWAAALLVIVAVIYYSPNVIAANNITNRWSFTTLTPTGTCNQAQAWVKMPAGTLYTCQNGTAAAVSGGGGVTSITTTSPLTGCSSPCTTTATIGTTTPPTGASYAMLGSYSYTGAGTIAVAVGFQGVNSGIIYAFTAQTPTITKLDYTVVTPAVSGGMIMGITSADQTTIICSVVVTGTNVTGVGAHSAAISGCAGLIVGGGYRWVASSDSAVLTILSPDNSKIGPQVNASGADRWGSANAVSTGSGGTLAFTTLSAITWQLSATQAEPVITAEN